MTVCYYVGVVPRYASASAWAMIDQEGTLVAAKNLDQPMRRLYHGAVGAVLDTLSVPPVSGGKLFYRLNAAIESPWFGYRKGVIHKLSRISGLWEAALYTCGVSKEVWRPSSSDWRKMLQLPTYPFRQAQQETFCYANNSLHAATLSHNIAAACCIARALQMHCQT